MEKINKLNINDSLKKYLSSFCGKIIDYFEDKLICISITGSAVTNDFSDKFSDINLYCILKTLDIKDLKEIALWVKKSWQYKRISPRFISLRNLNESIKYYPIDFWSIKLNHVTVYGDDIFTKIQIDNKDLVWQLNHEITGLRMRIKQQYWICLNNVKLARKKLLINYNNCIYLIKVILTLKKQEATNDQENMIKKFYDFFKINNNFMLNMLKVKQNKINLKIKDIPQYFEDLFDLIRIIDDISKKF